MCLVAGKPKKGINYDDIPAAERHYEVPTLVQGVSVSRNHDPRTLLGTSEEPAQAYSAAVSQFGAVGAQSLTVVNNNKAIEARRVVHQDLGPDNIKTLSQYFGTNVHCDKTDTSLNGHKFLVAGKSLIKQDHDRKQNFSAPTVIHGASYVDIVQHKDNRNVKFYVWDNDDRDRDRSIKHLAGKICEKLVRVETFTGSHSQMAKKYLQVYGYNPDRVIAGGAGFTTTHIVFADNAYEFTKEEFLKILKDSQCSSFSGYMVLPYELLKAFSWYNSPHYVLQRLWRNCKEYVTFTPHDGQNGYCQPLEGYTKFLESPVLNSRTSKYSVVVELHSAGCFTWFSGYPSTQLDKLCTRVLTGPEEMEVYSVADFYSAYSTNNKNINYSNINRIDVLQAEWDEVAQTLATISDRDLNVVHVSALYKRCMGGFKAMQCYLGLAHKLKKKYMTSISLSMYLWERERRGLEAVVMHDDPANKVYDNMFLKWLRKISDYSNGLGPFSSFVAAFTNRAARGSIVLSRRLQVPQTGVVQYYSNIEPLWQSLPQVTESCPFCTYWEFGAQVVWCQHRDPKLRVVLSDGDADALRTKYSHMKTVEAGGLQVVGAKALDNVPIVGGEVITNAWRVQGPAGCGKSWFIRKAIEKCTNVDGANRCMVVVAVHKLLEAYEAFTNNNDKYHVMTPDVAMKARGYRYIFFDEIQCMDARVVKAVVINNLPTDIFLVGDIHQPAIEPKLGFNVWSDGEFPSETMSTHTFCVDFRNMPDTVASVKTAHPEFYHMLLADPRKDKTALSVTIIKGSSKHLYRTKKYLEMHHVREMADRLGCTTTQEAVGSEADYAVSHMDEESKQMWLAPDGAHNIVSMTRAKVMHYIHVDPTLPWVVGVLAKWGLSIETGSFIGDMSLAFTSNAGTAPTQKDQDKLEDPRGVNLTIKDVAEMDIIAKTSWECNEYRHTDKRKTPYHGKIMQSVGKSEYLKFECEKAVFDSGKDVLIYIGGCPGSRLVNLPGFKKIIIMDPGECTSNVWTVVGAEGDAIFKAIGGKARIHWKARADAARTLDLQAYLTKEKLTYVYICDIRSTSGDAARNFQTFTPDVIKLFDFAVMFACVHRTPGSLIKFTPIYGEYSDTVNVRSVQMTTALTYAAKYGFDAHTAVQSKGFSLSGVTFTYLEGLKEKGVEMRCTITPDVKMTAYIWQDMYKSALAHYVHRQLFRPKERCCAKCDKVSVFEHGQVRYNRGSYTNHTICSTRVVGVHLGKYIHDTVSTKVKLGAGVVKASAVCGLGLVCVCGKWVNEHRTHAVVVGSYDGTIIVVGQNDTKPTVVVPKNALPSAPPMPKVPPSAQAIITVANSTERDLNSERSVKDRIKCTRQCIDTRGDGCCGLRALYGSLGLPEPHGKMIMDDYRLLNIKLYTHLSSDDMYPLSLKYDCVINVAQDSKLEPYRKIGYGAKQVYLHLVQQAGMGHYHICKPFKCPSDALCRLCGHMSCDCMPDLTDMFRERDVVAVKTAVLPAVVSIRPLSIPKAPAQPATSDIGASYYIPRCVERHGTNINNNELCKGRCDRCKIREQIWKYGPIQNKNDPLLNPSTFVVEETQLRMAKLVPKSNWTSIGYVGAGTALEYALYSFLRDEFYLHYTKARRLQWLAQYRDLCTAYITTPKLPRDRDAYILICNSSTSYIDVVHRMPDLIPDLPFSHSLPSIVCATETHTSPVVAPVSQTLSTILECTVDVIPVCTIDISADIVTIDLSQVILPSTALVSQPVGVELHHSSPGTSMATVELPFAVKATPVCTELYSPSIMMKPLAIELRTISVSSGVLTENHAVANTSPIVTPYVRDVVIQPKDPREFAKGLGDCIIFAKSGMGKSRADMILGLGDHDDIRSVMRPAPALPGVNTAHVPSEFTSIQGMRAYFLYRDSSNKYGWVPDEFQEQVDYVTNAKFNKPLMFDCEEKNMMKYFEMPRAKVVPPAPVLKAVDLSTLPKPIINRWADEESEEDEEDDEEEDTSMHAHTVINVPIDCYKPVCKALKIPETNNFFNIAGKGTWANHRAKDDDGVSIDVYGEAQENALAPVLMGNHVYLIRFCDQGCDDESCLWFYAFEHETPKRVKVFGRYQKIYGAIQEKFTRSQFKRTFQLPWSPYKDVLTETLGSGFERYNPHKIMEIVEPEPEYSKSPGLLEMYKTLVPDLAQHTMSPFNAYNNTQVDYAFKNARVSVSVNDVRINTRGHFVNTDTTRLSLTNVYGNVFSNNNPTELLRVSAKRYNLKGVPPKPLTPEILVEINDMLVFHFNIYHRRERIDITEQLIDEIVDGMLCDARDRKYDKRYYGEGWNHREDWLGMRVALKQCDKIANMTKGYNPAGVAQGIMCSTLGLNAKYQMVTRLMQAVRLMSIRKDDYVYGVLMHGQSVEEFVTEVAASADKFRFIHDEANSDIAKCDSGGTPCITYLNKLYWEKLGFNKELIDELFTAANNVPARSTYLSFTKAEQNPSGWLLTKAYTEIAQEVLGNYVLDGIGPVVWNGCGDDFNKKQGGLHINANRMDKIIRWSNFDFSFCFNQCVDFCGMLYNKGFMSLNLLMKTWKVASKNLPNQDLFEAYQLSIREYMELVRKIGVKQCVTSTCELYSSWRGDMLYDEGYACYMFLNDFCNATYEQYKELQEFRKYGMPVQEDNPWRSAEMIMRSEDICYVPKQLE
jgi:hypothetical protein